MRSALCLSGIIGGRGGKNGYGGLIDYADCYNRYKNHIIDVNSTDVFIHCWSPEGHAVLTELYQPKLSIVEKQKVFETGLPDDAHQQVRQDHFIIRSRWYSVQKAIQLKNMYEEQYGFKYDWVFLGRFDVNFFVDFDFSQLDNQYFYVSHFNDLGNKHNKKPNRGNRSLKQKRMLDLWFLGNSDFMDRFGNLYDYLEEYLKPFHGLQIDAHYICWKHVNEISNGTITKYMFYRWFDYELWRLKNG